MSSPIASVVIPAHDEGRQIDSTLRALLTGAEPGEFDVVVVCNGCRDDTASVARSISGTRVEELNEPSKIAALRRGDELAETFPRIYLDGDVELSTTAARALVAALDTDEPRVAGMVGRLDTAATTRPARWYFDFRQRLPVFHGGIIGAGVYALNEAGRARFGQWPDVLGDDQFVLRVFTPDERVTVAGHHTVVPAPRDLRTVVRRQIRIRRGNTGLTTGTDRVAPLPPPPAGVRAALRAVRATPSAWPGVATWTAVNALVRLLARLPVRGDWSASSAENVT